jgi:diadenosine tetraphosphate (Ap4A) HIT family hydrolase
MSNCEVCEIINGKMEGFRSKQNILKLRGNWVLNHYGNPSSGYLGYLVLSTKEHLTGWDKLSSDDLINLGLNIKWIDINLRECWGDKFPQDPIEQIYFAYFNDSAYILKIQGKTHNTSDLLHVHIHILPRTKKMLKICNGKMMAFDLLKLRERFPLEYICDDGDKRKLDIMKCLKSRLKNIDQKRIEI